MSGLLLKNINKIYPGGLQAVRDFNLEIKEHEFLVLSGPDGCGKSSLLRMIAGLEDITSGTLYMDGVDMTAVGPRERNVAMVFRNSVLYPHMDVKDNLAFALRMQKMNPAEIESRIKETAAILNLDKIMDKMPEDLTTVQTYRVLMGRALVRRPKVLLMDSTIADLDEEIQEVIRQEFLNLHKRVNTTIIYVTENQRSAMTLGSRMVVLDKGEICQDDTPENLLVHPKSRYVAGVVGYPPMNFFQASVYEEDGRIGLNFKKGKVLLPEAKGKELAEKGYLKKDVIAGIRADALAVLNTKKKGAEGTFSCKILGMEELYSRPVLRVVMDEVTAICLVDELPSGGVGSNVVLSVDAEKIQIFDRETDRTIVF